MKNDATTTALSFILVVFAIGCVICGAVFLWNNHEQRALQVELQNYQTRVGATQAIIRDAVAYNATAKNPEMDQLLKSFMPVQSPGK